MQGLQSAPTDGPHRAQLQARLSELDVLTDHLDDLERVSFRSLLVGAVCAHVSDEQWAAAVAMTIERFNAWSRAEQQSEASSNTDDPRL